MRFFMPPAKPWRRGLVLAFVASTGVLLLTNVPEHLDPEDAEVARELLGASPQTPARTQSHTSFEDQLSMVAAVQTAILEATPVEDSIPRRQPRELRHLVAGGKGLCFDRSRGIEQLLRFLGFEARHVAVYRVREGELPLKALFSPGRDSHAVTEVRTHRGWMLLGSNPPWMAVDGNGDPLNAVEFALRRNRADLIRSERGVDTEYWLFSGTWVPIRGLYSRHGEFYPPYWFRPDVNWLGLLRNLEILPMLVR